MRFFFLEHPADEHEKGRWPFYWAWVEADHAFVNAARENMGLEPLPTPSGLTRHRAQAKPPGLVGQLMAKVRPARPEMEHPRELMERLAPAPVIQPPGE